MANSNITKRAIADALKILMKENPLAKISVGDIVEVCGINRNSFYYHFKDKYDLVNWIFYTEFSQNMNKEDIISSSSLVLVEHICRFFYENKEFYVNALSVTGQNSFYEYFMELLELLIVERCKGMFEEDKDQEFFSIFFTDAFLSALYRWLTEGAEIPPDKFTELLRKALTAIKDKINEVDE